MTKKTWIFVPNNHRWCDIRERVDYLNSNKINSNHIICNECDPKRSSFKLFIKDVKETIKNHYNNSKSYNWKPGKNDQVFWLTVTYPSWIHSLRCTHSTNAVDQYKSTYNCYRTEQEVLDLKTKIEAIFAKYGI